MTIRFHADRPGQPRARVRCDEKGCDREEVTACERDNEGQARRKVLAKGWSAHGAKLFCPSCAARRRAHNAVKEATKMTEPEPPREPTPADRRRIMDLLGEVYAVDAGRYAGGETDDTVSQVLGVPPVWVARIREDFFGPDGVNDEVEALCADLRAAIEAGQAALKAHEAAAGQIRVAIARGQELEEQAKRIKKALGPRVLRVAGVAG